MTATILKPQATRTILFTVPATTPDPKFKLGDRVISFISEDVDEPDIHAGIVTGLSLDDDEWSYEVLPGNDELLRRLCDCCNPEDFSWFDESELEPLTPAAQAKAEWLLSAQPSYEELRVQQLIFTKKAFPEAFDHPRTGKLIRQEWNELMEQGYIPEKLGYMTV